MIKGLPETLAEASFGGGSLRFTVAEDWHQGRTAYGGFSAALALWAAQRAGGEDLPPLRSAQVSFVGPLHGAIEVTARVLRRGKNATWISAEVLREGEVGLAATFVFMRPIASVVTIDERPTPAGLIPFESARPVPLDRSPVFLQNHFEARFALPRGDGPTRETCWWMRLRDHDGLDPMVHLMACADASPPAVLPFLPPKAPISSMTWQCNLLHPAPVTREGWWLLRISSDFSHEGGASDLIDLWTAEGVPVMASMQSVAVFG